MPNDEGRSDKRLHLRWDAHDRAAATREEPADGRQQSAGVYEPHGSLTATLLSGPQPTRTPPRLAAGVNALSQGRPILLRRRTGLGEIEERLERLRDETEVLVNRVRTAVESSRTARDGDIAHERVATLRQDLDVALAEIAGLRTAMESRAVIEQAKGMIMLRLGVDADTAFQFLVKTSQQAHTKLVDVARNAVARVPGAITAVDR